MKVGAKYLCTATADAAGKVGPLKCSPMAEEKRQLTKSHLAAVTRYVKGGAPGGGDGTQASPWNNLKTAELANWTTLIILPSPTILDQGITLKDGQTIQGQQKDQALLATYNNDTQNGDVIVTSGTNTIKNLIIVEAYRSAIQALDSDNLTVSNVHIQKSNTRVIFETQDSDVFSYDWVINSTASAFVFYWPAISFFGGPTRRDGLQALNTRSGLFILEKSTINGFRVGVIVGSGNNAAQSAILPTYNREYRITDNTFALLDTNRLAGNAIIVYGGPGSIISGTINRNIFRNVPETIADGDASGVEYYSTNSNVNVPGRAQLTFKTNTVQNSVFENLSYFGVRAVLSSDYQGTAARFVVDNNTFKNFGTAGTTAPAIIEENFAAIQIQTQAVGSGQVKWIVTDNEILDLTGLVPGITSYLSGPSIVVTGEIQKNLIDGTTTGIDFVVGNGTTPQPTVNANYYVANNIVRNVDSAMVVVGSATDPNGTNVKIVVEKNCFENTGNRQAQLGRPANYAEPISGAGASYYGGTIIYGGGLSNPAVSNNSAVTSEATKIILDLGGGDLGSKGLNNFLKTVGPHTWVEAGLFLAAEHNWFGGVAPRAAGAGEVDFEPQLTKGPKTCQRTPVPPPIRHCQESSSSSSSCSFSSSSSSSDCHRRR